MPTGRQIKLYLVDGSPGGLMTAEIMNWTGHVIAAPRSDIGELLNRDEARRTGVYLLLGDDTDLEHSGGSAVYVGEGDDIAQRLRQHARPSDAGGKDFWDRVVILTSKDANLTKAHARYLEARLIAAATSARRSRVLNATAPTPLQLPEADVADMEYFLSQVHIVLPVLGVNDLRSGRVRSAASAALASPAAPTIPVSPVFKFEVARHGLAATAQEIDGEFTVLEGSTARAEWVGTQRHPGYQQLHEKLLASGALVTLPSGNARFSADTVFASPSAAAAAVAGRTANGRTSWVEVGTGITFGEWQSRGLPEAIPDR